MKWKMTKQNLNNGRFCFTKCKMTRCNLVLNLQQRWTKTKLKNIILPMQIFPKRGKCCHQETSSLYLILIDCWNVKRIRRRGPIWCGQWTSRTGWILLRNNLVILQCLLICMLQHKRQKIKRTKTTQNPPRQIDIKNHTWMAICIYNLSMQIRLLQLLCDTLYPETMNHQE